LHGRRKCHGAARKAGLLADAARNTASSCKSAGCGLSDGTVLAAMLRNYVEHLFVQAEIEGITMATPQAKPVETIE
jgi:hypothetical protein